MIMFILIVIFTTFQLMHSLGFFRCFCQTWVPTWNFELKPFTSSMGVDCYNSVNHNQVEVLNHSKYSLLFLPEIRIEPATTSWFQLAVDQPNAYICHAICLAEQFRVRLWDLKPNIFINTYELLIILCIFFLPSSYCNFFGKMN